jgi:hypothetical protein
MVSKGRQLRGPKIIQLLTRKKYEVSLRIFTEKNSLNPKIVTKVPGLTFSCVFKGTIQRDDPAKISDRSSLNREAKRFFGKIRLSPIP